MQLDILHITSGIYSSAGALQPTLTLVVVPADHDKILIGENYVFSKSGFHLGDRQRISARIIFTNSDSDLEFAKDNIDPEKMRGESLSGYGKIYFGNDEGDTADLVFFLFADDTTIAELTRQMQGIGPGDLSANVDLRGLDFALPDEEVWKKPDGENHSFLPITSFGLYIRQLATTRREIGASKEKTLDKELLDSDDIDTVRRTAGWIKEAEVQNPDPMLKAVKELRVAVFALLVLVAMLVYFARQ